MFKTFGIAALASIVALVVGFGALGTSTPPAQAETTDVVVIGCEFIASAVDGDTTDGTPSSADVQAACGGDSNALAATGFGTSLPATGATSITALANAIGDEDGELEKSDFADIEGYDDNQISTDCSNGILLNDERGASQSQFLFGQACTLDVFVFVNDEGPVKIDLPSGLATIENGNLDFTCTTDVGYGATSLAATTAIVDADNLANAVHIITVGSTAALATGDVVTIAGQVNNPLVNGTWAITVINATTFSLNGSTTVAANDGNATGTVTTLENSAADMRVDNDCADGTDATLGTDTNGDGVVLFHVVVDTTGAGAGDTKTVFVSQEAVEQDFDINVVGPPNDVKLTLAESLIETNGNTSNVDDCVDNTDVTEAIDPPTSTVAWAVVTDQDDTPLARVPVIWDIDPPAGTDIAQLGLGNADEDITGNTHFTLASDGVPTAAYRTICGGKNTGEVTIDAEINIFQGPILSSTDHSAKDITVGGAPSTNVLTAEASTIKCDGSEKSTVTAKVTDSNGDNVADGVPVNFSVVALGTANPINTETKDGVATSVITPLSNSSAGVTVIVTAGDSGIKSVVQTSVRVDCALPLASQAPPPAPTPRGGIGGPDTGSGGYLGQSDSNSFPAWALIALALGSMTLVAGGLVTRRAGK